MAVSVKRWDDELDRGTGTEDEGAEVDIDGDADKTVDVDVDVATGYDDDGVSTMRVTSTGDGVRDLDRLCDLELDRLLLRLLDRSRSLNSSLGPSSSLTTTSGAWPSANPLLRPFCTLSAPPCAYRTRPAPNSESILTSFSIPAPPK